VTAHRSPEKELLSNVTGPQAEAITHVEGPLLVLAGAGSGKTLVITRRIAHLIESGVPPESILAITFTNKASGEMRERVERLTGHDRVWISTFHSFAARLLRRHIDALGFTRSFSIYDTVDQVDCVKEAMRELSIDTTQWRPAAVASRISHHKNRMTVEELEQGDLFDRIVASVRRRYSQILGESNALDFDDLLLHLIRLFETDPGVLASYRDRFRFVLIDEYQDTNRPQYLLARMLSEEHRNICATGDPDQSIYRWRGADIHNILNFEEDFPGARVVKLEENFRSTGRILSAASSVIAHNKSRKEKTLWTRNPTGSPVRLVTASHEWSEAEEVIEGILGELQSGRSPREIAVFFRTNVLSRTLERRLVEEAIPYTIVGTVEFFRRREIKDLLAFLRLRENPDDSASFERVVNVPRRGVGAKALAAIRRAARERGTGLLAALDDAGTIEGLSGRGRSGAVAFAKIQERLRGEPDRPVADVVRRVVELTGYDEYLCQGEASEAEDRLENVAQLVAAAAEYDHRNPAGDLLGFLEEVALISDVDRWDRDEPRVTLMTLHAAKGLEFPVVYIVGAEEGLLPHHRSTDSQMEIEEERRLFHVGITRAKERLTVTRAAVRSRFGAPEPTLPSRFLDEMPCDDVERIERGTSPPTFEEVPELDDGPDLRAGDVVQHQYFGIGTILDVTGEGSQSRAVVRFENGDERKLLLQYAKLSKLD